MLKVRSHRPVTGLKPVDYDHEIGLVNHEEEQSPPTPLSSDADPRRTSTTSRLISLAETEQEDAGDRGPEGSASGELETSGIESRPPNGEQQLDRLPEELDYEANLPHPAMQPSIEVQGMLPTASPVYLCEDSPYLRRIAATPHIFDEAANRVVPRRPKEKRETAIDILYENERGGFLCGTALFSSKALGSLDPPAWSMYDS